MYYIIAIQVKVYITEHISSPKRVLKDFNISNRTEFLVCLLKIIVVWGFFLNLIAYQFSSVAQCVQLFATSWTTARQSSRSFTNSWSLFKLMSIESVMPYNHFILRCPLLLLPLIFPTIRVFTNESVLRIRWPKYWSFSFSKYYGLNDLIATITVDLHKQIFENISLFLLLDSGAW